MWPHFLSFRVEFLLSLRLRFLDHDVDLIEFSIDGFESVTRTLGGTGSMTERNSPINWDYREGSGTNDTW